MTFDHFVAAMRRGWLLIVLFVVMGAVMGGIVSLVRTPQYASTVSIVIAADVSNGPTGLSEGASYVNGQMESYLALLDKSAVLEPIANEIGGDISEYDLRSMISVNVPPGSNLMDITARTDDPQEASAIASRVPDALQTAISAISPLNATGTPFVRVIEVQEAAPPLESSTPSFVESGQAGAVVGLVLGILAAMGRYVSQARAESKASRGIGRS